MDKKQVPFDENFVTKPLYPLENVRLIGSKCLSCGMVSFGRRYNCEQCTSSELEDIVLSNRGKVYSYSIIRNPSPPPYVPPDPFEIFPAAWVELPEGLKIISPLKNCEPDQVCIGMEVELVMDKGWEDEDGNSVIAYSFRPVK